MARAQAPGPRHHGAVAAHAAAGRHVCDAAGEWRVCVWVFGWAGWGSGGLLVPTGSSCLQAASQRRPGTCALSTAHGSSADHPPGHLLCSVAQVLLIVAATHLDAVAFQIFSQSFKLVPTALFAYWLLGQMLEPMQASAAAAAAAPDWPAACAPPCCRHSAAASWPVAPMMRPRRAPCIPPRSFLPSALPLLPPCPSPPRSGPLSPCWQWAWCW